MIEKSTMQIVREEGRKTRRAIMLSGLLILISIAAVPLVIWPLLYQ